MNIMLDEGAVMPTRAHKIDAGLDLYAKQGTHVTIPVGGSVAFDTGVHVEIPTGWTGLVKSKSGLNVKHGLLSDGVVDAGFTGSIVVKLYNHSDEPYGIERGDKIAFVGEDECMLDELRVVDTFAETERGNNGFGSTGV